MSNIIPANQTLPSYLTQYAARSVAINNNAIGGISGGSFPRIGLKSSRFHVINGGEETLINSLTLDVIIVGANPGISKALYVGDWNPDERNKPDCFSEDGIRPDISVANPIAPTCASCPKNQWGTGVSRDGKTQTKACSDNKRLAIIGISSDGQLTPLIYQLTIKPTSLKDFRTYASGLIAPLASGQKIQVPLHLVITRLSFDPTASYPKLQFQFGGYLPDNVVKMVEERISQAETEVEINDITGYSRALESASAIAPTQGAYVQPSLNTTQTKGNLPPQPIQQPVINPMFAAPEAEHVSPVPVQQAPVSAPQPSLNDVMGMFNATPPMRNPVLDILAFETRAVDPFAPLEQPSEVAPKGRRKKSEGVAETQEAPAQPQTLQAAFGSLDEALTAALSIEDI